MTEDDYDRLIAGSPPECLELGAPIASPEVLKMLAGVAANVRQTFAPASWLIVTDLQAVGLCSIVKPPKDGVVEIGYGISPSRRGQGLASQAVKEVVTWAKQRPDIIAVAAETRIENLASQSVLIRNGFLKVGERFDTEDGSLICWRCETLEFDPV